MTKYRIAFTYSEWENGQGWKIEGAYMGIDDKITDDKTVLDYDKDDLISDIKDYVADEIANYEDNGEDTRYSYTVYEKTEDDDENEVYSVSVWLSELAKGV